MTASQWQVSNRLQIHYTTTTNIYQQGQFVEIPIEIKNPTQNDVIFDQVPFTLAPKVVFLLYKRNYHIVDTEIFPQLGKLETEATYRGMLRFKMPDISKDKYKFSIVAESFFGHTLNSNFESISIE